MRTANNSISQMRVSINKNGNCENRIRSDQPLLWPEFFSRERRETQETSFSARAASRSTRHALCRRVRPVCSAPPTAKKGVESRVVWSEAKEQRRRRSYVHRWSPQSWRVFSANSRGSSDGVPSNDLCRWTSVVGTSSGVSLRGGGRTDRPGDDDRLILGHIFAVELQWRRDRNALDRRRQPKLACLARQHSEREVGVANVLCSAKRPSETTKRRANGPPRVTRVEVRQRLQSRSIGVLALRSASPRTAVSAKRVKNPRTRQQEINLPGTVYLKPSDGFRKRGQIR
jgi:hypothetical protein